jgi:hypothetical protein
MGEKLKAVIQRWRQRRQHRKQRRREDPGYDIGRAAEVSRRDAQLRRQEQDRWGSGL